MDSLQEITNEDILRMLKAVRQVIDGNTCKEESSHPVAELEKCIGLLGTSYGVLQREKDRLEMRNIDLLSREIELNSKCVQYQMEVARMENTVKEQERQIRFKDDEIRNIRLILEQRIEEENRKSMERDVAEYELSAKITDNEEIMSEMEALLVEKETVVEQLEGNIHQLTEEIFKVNEIIDKQHRELEEKESEVKQASKHSFELGNENQLLRSKIQKINKKSEILKQSLEDLENDLVKKRSGDSNEKLKSPLGEASFGELQRKLLNFESKIDSIADSLLLFGGENDRLTVRICDILDEVLVQDSSTNGSSIHGSNTPAQEAEHLIANDKGAAVFKAECKDVRETSYSENIKRNGLLLSEETNGKQNSIVESNGNINRNATGSSKALLRYNNRSNNDKDFGCRSCNHKSEYEILNAGNRITFVEGATECYSGVLESLSDQILGQQKAEGMDAIDIQESENSLGIVELMDQKTISDLSPAEISLENNVDIDCSNKETTQQEEKSENGRSKLLAESKCDGLEGELECSTSGETNSSSRPICNSDLDENRASNYEAMDINSNEDPNAKIRDSSQVNTAHFSDRTDKNIDDMLLHSEAAEHSTQCKSAYVLTILEEINENSTLNKEQQDQLPLVQAVPDVASHNKEIVLHEVENASNNKEIDIPTAVVHSSDFAAARCKEGEGIENGRMHLEVEFKEVDEEYQELEVRFTHAFLVTKEEKIISDELIEKGANTEPCEGAVLVSVNVQDEEQILKRSDNKIEIDSSVISDSDIEAQKTEEACVEVEVTVENIELDFKALTLEQPELLQELEVTIGVATKGAPIEGEAPGTPVPTPVSSPISMKPQAMPDGPMTPVDYQPPANTEIISLVVQSVSEKTASRQKDDTSTQDDLSEESPFIQEAGTPTGSLPVIETPIVSEVFSPDLESTLEKMQYLEEASTSASDALEVATDTAPLVKLPSSRANDALSARTSIVPQVLDNNVVSKPSITEETDNSSNVSLGHSDDALTLDMVHVSVEPALSPAPESSGFSSKEMVEVIKVGTTSNEMEPTMSSITMEENFDWIGSEDETVSTTSSPALIRKTCETESLDSSIEDNAPLLTEKENKDLVKRFDDDIDVALLQQEDLNTEPATMNMRIDSPNRSSVEIPSHLVSSLIKENTQLRKKMEELTEEKSALLDEIDQLKSNNDVEMKLKHEIDTFIAEKALLLDQIDALKGIMLDFDEKYKEETNILEQSKEQLKVEIEEMKRVLAEKDDFLLAAKVRENYLLSTIEKKRREVADLEASLSMLNSKKSIKEGESFEAIEKELEERRKEVEDLKAKLALRQTAPGPDTADQIIPEPASPNWQEEIEPPYGGNDSVTSNGGNKTQKKKKYKIFCS